MVKFHRQRTIQQFHFISNNSLKLKELKEVEQLEQLKELR
jgi:hypothetical protein